MNETQNVKNQKAVVVITKDFGIDVSQDLSTTNLILLKIFVFLQVISLFLVLILINNDYSYHSGSSLAYVMRIMKTIAKSNE